MELFTFKITKVQEMELSSSNIEKFSEIELSRRISFLYFRKETSESFSYIFGNETFLYFLKTVFFIFQETKLSSLKNKKFQQGIFQARKNKKNSLLKSYIY